MNILIFIIVLGVLVFIHELGHFLFAKLFNIRVEEFGFGYPPKALKLGNFRGTDITLNWIPFGGFVRILGEGGNAELSEEDKKASIGAKPRWQQFLVMAGGIIFNIIFAWILISASYMGGIQSSVDNVPKSYEFEETQLAITSVQTGSPAYESGLEPGDIVLEYRTPDLVVYPSNEDTEDFSSFINDAGSKGQTVEIAVLRGEGIEAISVTPQEGVIEGRFGIGVGINQVGELRLGFFQALGTGLVNTFLYLGLVVDGFVQLITGSIPLDAVSGPVGIVGQVGQATALGFTFLLSFTALLSLNLAVLNAFPFPALDGGRMLIIIIESIIGRSLPEQAVNWVNVVGFFILIAFMIFITIKDILVLI